MSDSNNSLTDEEIALLNDRDREKFALSEKLRAIREGRRKLKERRVLKPEEAEFINAQRDELNLKKQPIIDRRDAISEGQAFSPPTEDQVKLIRDAVNSLSSLNAAATLAVSIAETAVDILEMAVGNDAMASG